MKLSSKLAVFCLTAVLPLWVLVQDANAQSLNLEVESVTNPWIANNSIYCTGSNSICNPKQFYKRPVPEPSPSKNLAVKTTPPAYQPIPETPEYKSNLDSTVLFGLVNEYRAQNNQAPFLEEEKICKIAEERTPALYNEIFGDSWMHRGFYELNLPYWATENIIYEFSEEKALNWWKNSPIHNKALLGNYQYSCVRCLGNTCAQIFTNFQEKYIPLTSK